MFEEVLNSQISSEDRARSISSLARLQPLVVGEDRSLVFFVGAGASSAGNTGMPSTQALLRQLLTDALVASGKFTEDDLSLESAIGGAAASSGFETTLNDLWQICPRAIARFFGSYAALEKTCLPNRVHAFLAYWLSTGGTVVTTNYDRLIEADCMNHRHAIRTRYKEAGDDSFQTWQRDLMRGGCLFKLHGSLDEPESCLGALEHVGTRLGGNRAALLEAIVGNRPICFVGWRGADPDIPPVLAELSSGRSAAIPTFWLHHHGSPAGSKHLHTAVDKVPTQVHRFAFDEPVLADADEFFGGLLSWVRADNNPNPHRQAVTPALGKVLEQCSRSGLARFAGIVLRRARQFAVASAALEAAKELATTTGEHRAAILEIAQLKWSRNTGRDQAEALGLVRSVGNADFGLLSMTILSIKSRPWLVLLLPRLFRRYKLHIQELKNDPALKESAALHESLINLYSGRLRLELFGWLGAVLQSVADWILHPLNVARAVIDDAGDIHTHSRIDVLSYRAVALARFGRCEDAWQDVREIDRLVGILSDEAKAVHWEHQRSQLRQRCPEDQGALPA